MNALLNGIVNGFMFWVVIIILIITGCIIVHFFATIASVILGVFFCVFWFNLFTLASARERIALIVATAIFINFIAQNPENWLLWLGGTVVLGAVGLTRQTK